MKNPLNGRDTSANYTDLYTGNKGDIQFAEISLPFNGFFINNDYVYQKAQDMLLAMRNPANLTNTRVIVDSNNFKYNAIAQAGIHEGVNDKFSTPGYWSESDGNAKENASKIVNKPNTDNRAYYGFNPGSEDGKITGEENFKYADVVASMGPESEAGGEHFINGGNKTNDTYALNRQQQKIQDANTRRAYVGR